MSFLQVSHCRDSEFCGKLRKCLFGWGESDEYLHLPTPDNFDLPSPEITRPNPNSINKRIKRNIPDACIACIPIPSTHHTKRTARNGVHGRADDGDGTGIFVGDEGVVFVQWRWSVGKDGKERC